MSGQGEQLGSLLPRILGELDLGELLGLSRIRASWPAIAGPELLRVCRPAMLSRGKLTVVATHPSWAQQIGFYKARLLANIARECPGVRVDEVIVRVGRLPVDGARKEERAQQGGPPLTSAERSWIEEAVGKVAQEDLRDTLRRALEAALRSSPDR